MTTLLHSFRVGITVEGEYRFTALCEFRNSQGEEKQAWLESVIYADGIYDRNPKAFDEVLDFISGMGYTSIVTDFVHPFLALDTWEKVQQGGYPIFRKSLIATPTTA